MHIQILFVIFLQAATKAKALSVTTQVCERSSDEEERLTVLAETDAAYRKEEVLLAEAQGKMEKAIEKLNLSAGAFVLKMAECRVNLLIGEIEVAKAQSGGDSEIIAKMEKRLGLLKGREKRAECRGRAGGLEK